MSKVSEKSCAESQNHILFSNFFFPPENRAVYGTMWNNVVQSGRPQMRIRRVQITYWIQKATNTHAEYVIPFAFPLQQCLHEGASVVRHVKVQGI